MEVNDEAMLVCVSIKSEMSDHLRYANTASRTHRICAVYLYARLRAACTLAQTSLDRGKTRLQLRDALHDVVHVRGRPVRRDRPGVVIDLAGYFGLSIFCRVLGVALLSLKVQLHCTASASASGLTP